MDNEKIKENMQTMFDEDIFKERLRLAIGDRKKTDYARDINMSPQQLNTMLNKKNLSVPTVKTLKKIAGIAENGITLRDLGEAVGYSDDELFDEEHAKTSDNKYKTSDEKNEEAELEVFEKLQNAIDNTRVYKTVDSFVQKAIKQCSKEEYMFTVDEPKSVCIDNTQNGEKRYLYPVEVSWSEGLTVSKLIFALKVMSINGNKIITGIIKNARELSARGLISDEMREILGASFIETADSIHIIEDATPTGGDAFRNIMMCVYEEQFNGTYAYAFEGYGFKPDNISDETFRDFITRHKHAYEFTEMEKELYRLFVLENKSSEDTKKALIEKYGADSDLIRCDYCGRIPCIITAAIMSRELGVWVDYFSDDWVKDEEDENKKMEFDQDDVILIDQRESNMSGEWDKRAMNKYAKELKLTRFGYQYYFEKRSKKYVDDMSVF